MKGHGNEHASLLSVNQGDSCYIHECIDSTHTPINLEEIVYLHDYILARKMD